jgi:hypothetical protein
MLLHDVATYLDTQVASLTLGTNLFMGNMPDTPVESVAMYEYTAGPPIETLGGADTAMETPRVQVIVRSSDYATGRALIESIWKALRNVANTTLSGTRYQRIAAVDSPTFMQRDANYRPMFVCNFEIMKVPDA